MFGTVLNLLVKVLPSRLPTLLAERPDLLVDHALAYVALARSEIESVKRECIRRVVAGAVALASALAFMVLAGVSLMLHATRQSGTDMNWVLFAVPSAMLVLTLLATCVAASKGETIAATIGTQLQLDLQSFRAVMESRS